MSTIKIILQAGAIIILGRMLSPNDFGLIGMISIFIALSTMIVDSGMGASILRKKEVAEIEYSTLFIYNMAVSIIIYILLYYMASYIATFYKQEQLNIIIKIISINIIINALYRCQYTKLLKDFKYKELSIITIISNLIATIVAICLAQNKYGVWSLVFMQITEMAMMAILCASINRYIPSLQFSTKVFKEQFAFGIHLFGASTLKTISDNIQANIIAKIMPLSVTGYFVQAQRIQHVPSLIITSVLDKVMFPKLAIIQNPKVFKNNFITTTTVIAIFCIAVTFYISLIASDITSLLLGEKWLMAGNILSLLIFILIPDSLKIICRNALKSLGNSKLILKNELLFSITIIGAIITSYRFNIYGMVISIIISYTITAIIILISATQYIQITKSSILKIYIKYISIFSFIYLVIIQINKQINTTNNIMNIVIITILYSIPCIIICARVKRNLYNK